MCDHRRQFGAGSRIRASNEPGWRANRTKELRGRFGCSAGESRATSASRTTRSASSTSSSASRARSASASRSPSSRRRRAGRRRRRRRHRPRIRHGEFFSMLGPSGSGKTTTLRMIAGFELPTSGRILLDGKDVSNRPPFERDVNTVFQDYALFPHMTVGDNVGYGLAIRKVPRADRERRVAAALEMVRLDGYERQAGPALGRPAAAGRARAGARQPAPGPPPRRAARRPRPQAPRGDAARAQGDPAGGRDHLHLRDPRPGGGAHDERPPGRLQPRPDRAGRHAGRGLRAAGDAVRGRVRRHVEPAQRRGRRADRRPARHVHGAAREDPARGALERCRSATTR